jgi:FKBP-type peptidyl-prolyl cis-trans isomerase FklB
MRIRSITLPSLAVLVISMTGHAADAPDLKDQKQKLSYALGTQVEAGLKKQGVDIDPKAFAQGMADAIAGKLALSDADIKQVLDSARSQLAEKQQARQQVEAATNAKAGEAFLAANAKKDGVKTTASGLQYKVIKAGTGRTPTPKDTVKVNYEGKLIDGTVFDSSVARGQPVTFEVDGVIAGWTEALQLMKEGDKWQIVIPAKLAYGAAGAGDRIGPNEVLVFEVELIDIEKPGAAKTP